MHQKIFILNPFSYQYLSLPKDPYKDTEFIIVADIKTKKTYYDCEYKVIFTNNFDESELIPILNTKINSQKQSRFNFFAFSEETVPLSGLLNKYYGGLGLKNEVNNFTDKFSMRSNLKGRIEQPNFCKGSNVNQIEQILKTGSVIVKPRVSSGARGIHVLTRIEELEELYIDNNYIVEEFVEYDEMYTTDGIYNNGNIVSFHIHKYGEKILDSIEKNDFATVISGRPFLNEGLIQQLYKDSHFLLNQLSGLNGIFPFHIEWFFDKKRKKFIFCEAAARFGGALIPELIAIETGSDIKEILWNTFDGREYDKPVINNKIAATFLGYRKNGKLTSIPSENYITENWVRFYKRFVLLNEKYSYSQNAVENTFLCAFEAENLNEVKLRLETIIDFHHQFNFEVGVEN